MDRHTKEQRSKNMKAVKNKGSKIETILSTELWSKGYRYRKNNKKVYGKPDLTFAKYKVAVFVDGEFWHGKDWDLKRKEIKSNIAFWQKKIESNIERDKEVNQYLTEHGWTVLRFWGKDILKSLDNCVKIIEDAINANKRKNID